MKNGEVVLRSRRPIFWLGFRIFWLGYLILKVEWQLWQGGDQCRSEYPQKDGFQGLVRVSSLGNDWIGSFYVLGSNFHSFGFAFFLTHSLEERSGGWVLVD